MSLSPTELVCRLKRHPVRMTAVPGVFVPITEATCWCGSDELHDGTWKHPWKHLLDQEEFGAEVQAQAV